jgi:hypothetical protein
MAPVSIQTARLARGSHEGPGRGMCAMELVSMLAGAPFGDRPERVCPALAAFVRGYNDGIDTRRRQDLIRIAPDLLDARRSPELGRIRAERCFALAAEAHATGPLRLMRPRFPYDEEIHNLERAGRLAARAARRQDGWHARSVAFIAGLARLGAPTAPTAPTPPAAVRPLSAARARSCA